MKMKLLSPIGFIVLSVMFFAILAACVPVNTRPPATPTEVFPPTIQSLPATRATSTSTPTSLPTKETPTVTPTLVRIPTLPADQLREAYLGLHANNGNCELPCWWGIEPGKTNWQGAYQKLAPLGKVFTIVHGNTRQHGFSFTYTPEIDPEGYYKYGPTGPALYVQNEIVVAISINAGWIESGFDYSLAGILKTLGKPDEIWLNVTPISPSYHDYYIELVYFQKGILFTGTGIATVEGNQFTICDPDLMMGTGGLYAYPPDVFLWEPVESLTYRDLGLVLTDGILFDDYYRGDYFWLDDIAVDFDEQKFYETYLNPDSTACFSIDLDKVK